MRALLLTTLIVGSLFAEAKVDTEIEARIKAYSEAISQNKGQ